MSIEFVITAAICAIMTLFAFGAVLFAVADMED